METISEIQRPMNKNGQSLPQHRPLQRSIISTKNIPQTSELAAAHPLLFTKSSNIEKSFTSTIPSTIPSTITSAKNTVDTSNIDSCYSSCSEESHSSLSRESSDSATIEYNYSSSNNNDTNKIDENMLEFATKLGYTEENLRIVLNKLGSDAKQNNVLQELIQLGKTETKKLNNSTYQQHQRQEQDNIENDKIKLRPIIIDGPNIAMTHGHKLFFSCRGIRECVNFFINRGHKEIYVFVPQYRCENSRPDSPIIDQHILFELEKEKRLIWTPARRVNGRMIVCHDDRYILKTAEEKDGIIVSNDTYRDLIKENSQYKNMVEQRLLMYSFVDDKFMPPDDPLGRRGPKLDQFLSFTSTSLTAQLCPYAKKCTYGNKCKYYHPERKNGLKQSITDRLTSKNIKQNLRERPSMIYEGVVSKNLKNNQNQSMMQNYSMNNRNQVGRTQSLNVPLNQQQQQQYSQQQLSCYQNSFHQNHVSNPINTSMNLSNIWNPINQPNQQQHQQQQQHLPLNRNYSTPNGNNFDISNYHNLMNYSNDIQSSSRSNSLNDFCSYDSSPTNIYDNTLFQSTNQNNSFNIWGETMFPIQNTTKNNLINMDDQRIKLQYHLCQLFPESTVIAVMSAHPDETNAPKLCQMIIAFQKGFENQ